MAAFKHADYHKHLDKLILDGVPNAVVVTKMKENGFTVSNMTVSNRRQRLKTLGKIAAKKVKPPKTTPKTDHSVELEMLRAENARLRSAIAVLL
jgi:hypothetical protein